MTIITKRLDSLKKVVQTIDSIVRKAVINEQKLIAQMNREQLLAGKKATGRNMPNYASSNVKSGKINLFDKGPFHAGIEPLFEDEGVTLIGVDEKTGFLVARYGAILGLTPSNIKRLQKVVKPKIIIAIRKILGI